MQKVTGLTNDSKQRMTLVVGDNETCEFRLYFCPTQYSWYYDWKYKDITCNGNKVNLHPNILRQFKDRIPFGIAFFSEDLIPPFKLDDWTTRTSMYILDKSDIEFIEENIFNPEILSSEEKSFREVI